MQSEQAVISVRAFDEVAALQGASSMRELDRSVAPILADLGLPYCAAARFFRRDRSADTEVLFGSFHRGWARRYTARNYADRSQIARRMLEFGEPYSWGEVLEAGAVEPEQQRIWQEARDFGLKDGLGGYAAVVLGGEAPGLADSFVRIVVQVVSAFYGQAGRRLITRDAPVSVLTARAQRKHLAGDR